MSRKSVLWTLGAAVYVLITVSAAAQSLRRAGARTSDPAPTAVRPVEPDSPGTSSALTAGPQAVVPRLMKFSGLLRDAIGKPLSGTVDVTFALYNTEAGGTPLWYETQSVQVDESGRYTALLGVMHSDGLPIDLFTSGEVRWLGIQVGVESEQQPRVLLVSVPYALKAGDAATLGGKPASAYVLSESQNGATSSATNSLTSGKTQTGTSPKDQKGRTTNTTALTPCASVTSDGLAIANSIPMFTSVCNVESSVITQVNGSVGIGTASPQAALDVQGGSIIVRQGGSWPVILAQSFGSVFTITNGGTNQMAFDFNGNLGVGTTSPLGRVHVQNGPLVLQDGGAWPLSMEQGYGSVFTISNGGAPRMAIDALGNVGIGTMAPSSMLDVAGEINALGINSGAISAGPSTFAANSISGTQVINLIQNGNGTGLNVIKNGTIGTGEAVFAPVGGTAIVAQGGTAVNASTPSNTGTAIFALSTASSGATTGLNAQVQSSGGSAIQATSAATTGLTYGVQGTIHSPSGAAIFGSAPESTGTASGVSAYVASASAVAGSYQNNGGGTILLGFGSGTSPVFRLDGTGKGFFDGGTQTGGADFAESVAVLGKHSQYEPGDLLVIDSTGHRRLTLANKPYSTKVAGIYSTKPGVLATPHAMDNSKLKEEVPLAVVGIVPCKVTTQNGPIQVGDLLVSSSLPGYAMKGRNRSRMLGAVVGKALEPLEKGKGVIQVLVTLQ
ncbi:MAG TPA: hypothetical protein VG028_10610 [Terriglobia bacterium]|nr:hypothetical protein [Terriglobia bacterium]